MISVTLWLPSGDELTGDVVAPIGDGDDTQVIEVTETTTKQCIRITKTAVEKQG